MKNFGLLATAIFVLFISCDKNKQTDTFNNYENQLSKLLLENKQVSNKIDSVFSLNEEKGKLLKVVLSRKDKFLRITVYQILSDNEISEMPQGILAKKQNMLIYFNGNEVLLKKKFNKDSIIDIINSKKIKLLNDEIKVIDTRFLQFDLFSDGKIKFNYPPINPLDIDENKEIHFK